MNGYRPLHPELLALRGEDLEPAFLAAWSAGTPEAWAAVARELRPRVHTLRILTRTWCARLLEEVDHVEAWSARKGIALRRPNSMNEHGVILDEVGLASALDELVRRWLRPLTARLYPDLGGASLDGQHGFVVDYARGRDEDLGFHVDDSEVTLNLCLGERFDGSELYFRGLRCLTHRQSRAWPSEEVELDHEPGVAVLHAGKARHGVLPLRRGRRRNLILWCRSSSYRAALPETADCPPWCGARRPL